jgi:hypothetical protein
MIDGVDSIDGKLTGFIVVYNVAEGHLKRVKMPRRTFLSCACRWNILSYCGGCSFQESPKQYTRGFCYLFLLGLTHCDKRSNDEIEK